MKDRKSGRKGDKFEGEMSDMFERMGFNTKTHVFTKKRNGKNSEQDVLAEKANLRILIQCKDYAKFPNTKIEEVIEDLVEDGVSLKANKLLLAITGEPKDVLRWKSYAKEKGVYLWDEPFWRNLQKLDLYDLITKVSKNLEIEDILMRVSAKEKKMLKGIYEEIDTIKDPERKNRIFEELEGVEFTEEQKKDLQVKKVKNLINLEKEKEIREELKSKLEDIELEKGESLMGYYDFNHTDKYKAYEKLKREVSLSKDSKRIVGFELWKTYIDKIAEDKYGKNKGSEHLIKAYELWRDKKISKRRRDQIAEKARSNLGVNRRSEIDINDLEIGEEFKQALLGKKIWKIIIAIIIWLIIFIILWGILF